MSQPVELRDGKQLSDAELLSEIQNGAESAADELFRRYAPRLLAFARKRWPAVLASRLDPDDVIQSVFRSFFRHAHRGMYEIDADAELWNLLMVIVLNKIRVQMIRQCAAKRDVRRTQGGDVNWLDAVGADSEETWLELTVRELIEQFPGDHRRVAELRLEGYEVTEVAERIGRSKRTVERLLQECRERLLALRDDD